MEITLCDARVFQVDRDRRRERALERLKKSNWTLPPASSSTAKRRMKEAKPFSGYEHSAYAHAGADLRAGIAQELVEAGGVVSVQVLHEFAAVASRKLRRSWKEIRSALEDLLLLCPNPLPVTVELHEAALGIAERHGYTIYEASIIAAAVKGSAGFCFRKDAAWAKYKRRHHSQSVRKLVTGLLKTLEKAAERIKVFGKGSTKTAFSS